VGGVRISTRLSLGGPPVSIGPAGAAVFASTPELCSGGADSVVPQRTQKRWPAPTGAPQIGQEGISLWVLCSRRAATRAASSSSHHTLGTGSDPRLARRKEFRNVPFRVHPLVGNPTASPMPGDLVPVRVLAERPENRLPGHVALHRDCRIRGRWTTYAAGTVPIRADDT
jgi:hypothetical protein